MPYASVLKVIVSRSIRAAIVLLIVATLSFFILRAAPGGPFSEERSVPAAVLKNLEARYRLGDPLWKQLARYIGDLLRGDLGPSFRYADYSVNDLLAIGIPRTAALGASALLFALLIGVPLGAFAALRKGSAADRIISMISVAGLAMPSFVIGPLLVAVFAVGLGWFEPGGFETPAELVLPTLALGMAPLASILRLSRAGFLEVLSQDYIRMARAKGLPEHLILFRHAVRGALVPVLTYLGPACASVLTGSLVVESVFAIPGIGGYLVRGATNRDYPLVLGVILFGTVILVIANAIVDVLYAALDPRVRES